MRAVRSPVLVGRRAQVAAIEHGLDDAARGRGGCLVLLGEAGAGKTRILHEAAAQAKRRGMAVLTAGPSKIAIPPAYGVLSAALRSWTRGNAMPTEVLAPFAPGLRRILPEWPGPADPGLSADQVRLLALEGAFRLLVRTAGPAGVVLLLDDLQDADPESTEFLHHAAASAATEPVLIVATARTPEGDRVRREAQVLQARGQATLLATDPLSTQDVAELIESILEATPPQALVSHIVQRSGGVPLFVEELLDAHLRTGRLRLQAGGLRWDGVEGDPPQTTVEIAAEKLGRLSVDDRRVLIAAALLGRLDPDLLAAVTDLPPGAVVDGLRGGTAVGLLDQPPELAFRHALLRDALVQTLLPTERASLHRRAGDVLEASYGDDPAWLAERAHHLRSAGDDDRAAALLTQAGRWSLTRQAPASAEATLRQAVQFARTEQTAHDARDALAEAVGLLGRWDEALRLDHELCAGRPDDAGRLLRMAGNAVRASRLDEAEDLIRRAADAGGDPAPVGTLTALTALYRGDLAEAATAAQLALAADADPTTACQALDVLGRAMDALGQRAEAEKHFQRWIELARTSSLIAQQVQALTELGTLRFLAGGPTDELQQARELATRHAMFVPLVLADLSLVWWLGRRVRASEAATRATEAVDLCRRFSLDLLPHALMTKAWAENLAECDRGEPLVTQALTLAPTDLDLRILAHWIRGESALRSGRQHDAITSLAEATELMRTAPSAVPPPAPFLLPAAHLLADRRADATDALAAARSSPALARQYVNRLWLACDEALLAGAADALDEATAPYLESAPFDVALVSVVAAQTIGGDRSTAWLRYALDVFTTGGLETDSARVRQLLRTLGGPVPRRRRQPADAALRALGVTPREAEVLDLVTQGLTNPQIARRLFLSDRTVQTHVSSLLTKLHAGNRAGLIIAAYALGHRPLPSTGSARHSRDT